MTAPDPVERAIRRLSSLVGLGFSAYLFWTMMNPADKAFIRAWVEKATAVWPHDHGPSAGEIRAMMDHAREITRHPEEEPPDERNC